jgi:hypothetical protein
MSTQTILLLGLTVGLPCTLLAMAIIYHGRVTSQMPAADDGWDYEDEAALEEDPAFSVPVPLRSEPDPAVIELQQVVGELQGQLARQRAALTELLSDREPPPLQRPRPPAEPLRPAAQDASPQPNELHLRVEELVAEGLSERAIARRLRIGLEEVRLVSKRQERAS